MAIVYNAKLVPSKPDLIAAWLPTQPWFQEQSGAIEILGAFRFDDPNGQVGIETHIVKGASGTIYQVPLSYRGSAMADAGRFLVTELEHSVLGHRWVYDAAADPVAVAAFVAAIMSGQTQVDVFVDGQDTALPVSVAVQGTGEQQRAPQATLVGLHTEGSVTRVRTDSLALDIYRVVSGVRESAFRLDALSGFEGTPATLASVVSV
ncbi:MAG: CG0192-related protein [Gulosibacter sp.]|uniref:CG0192-related protein n=1 Tax=Gulosibacter sp. TaxID=2817531 RepID=UPI003F8E9B41